MGATDKPEKEVMKSRIEEVLSRILSKKHDVNIKIKFVPKDAKENKE